MGLTMCGVKHTKLPYEPPARTNISAPAHCPHVQSEAYIMGLQHGLPQEAKVFDPSVVTERSGKIGSTNSVSVKHQDAEGFGEKS